MQMQKILIRRLMFKILILAVTATGMPFSVVAQQTTITLPVRELTGREVFEMITAQTDYKFAINTSNFDDNLRVKVIQPQVTVTNILDRLFQGSGMTYAIESKYIVAPIRVSKSQAPAVRHKAKAPATGGILGVITNSITKETMADVCVEFVGTAHRATTDHSGRFLLEGIQPGNYVVRLTIPRYDTVIYRDMLVSAGTTNAVDINIPLAHTQGEKSASMLPVAGNEDQAGIAPAHTYVLTEANEELPLRHPRAAIKSNILHYAAATPNIGVEFGLAPRWSLDIALGMNPGKFDRNDGSLRHWYIQPEGRYWFRRVFEGHFIGLHGSALQFDLNDTRIGMIKDFRGKRYEGHAIGAGVSWGYHLPIGARWSMEFGLGVGYLYMDYREYEGVESSAYKRNNDKHYFGPTKVSISLMFML